MQDLEFAASRQWAGFAPVSRAQDFHHLWSAQDWRGEFRVSHVTPLSETAAAQIQTTGLAANSLGSSALAVANSLIAHSTSATLQHILDTQQGTNDLTANNTHFDNRIAPALVSAVAQAHPAFVSHNISLGHYSPSFNLPPPTTQSGGLNIHIIYDSSANSAPAAFKTAVANAVTYLESQFNDSIKINIHVGYGDVNGSPLDGGALGESSSFLFGFTYADIKSAMAADAISGDDSTALAHLAATDPTGDGHYYVTIAEARALGLYTASDTQVDGYVGFDNSGVFDYDNTNGVTGGKYDFFGVVLHELTEVMGRQLNVGGNIGGDTPSYEPLDLFHYNGMGSPIFVGDAAGYFSIDGGTTNLNDFNIDTNGGDAGDWADSAAPDAFLAFSGGSVINPMTEADLREMDILGFDRVSAGAPDLTADSVSLSATAFSFHINNAGSAVAGASSTGFYISNDATITTADTRLLAHASPALGVGLFDAESVALALPTGRTPGTYYLGVVADYNNAVAESNEGNNASTSIPIILGNNNVNTLNGTAGDDYVFALGGNDTIKLQGGGNDVAAGGDGNDTFNMGAAFNAADQIDGGTGDNSLALSGNYAAGVAFTGTTMVNVQHISVAAGNSYKLIIADATVGAGQSLNVNGATLGAGDTLTFNGLADTDGTLVVSGGAGNDTLSGGAGNDTLNGNSGNDTFNLSGGGNDTVNGGDGNDNFSAVGGFGAADKLDGGIGDDTLTLNGNYSAGVAFTATTMVNVEHVVLTAGHSYKLITNDATIGSGGTLAVNGATLGAGDVLNFNASAETNGTVTLTGGAGNDVLTGGAGNDTLNGNSGNDTLGLQSGGNDTANGGDGDDTFNMATALNAADKIDGGIGSDMVSLSGDYSGGVVFNAITIKNVETLTFATGFNYNITVNDGNLTTGQTLTVNASTLGAANTLTFNGSAESTGSFIFKGGAGGDNLTGGGGADTFVYGSAGQSTGSHYDTIGGFNFAADKFDLAFAVSAIDTALATGALNTASFNTDLATAMSGHLGAHHAILFTPNSGTLSGQTFLIVDANNAAGYQANEDLVFHMTGATGTLGIGDFI